MERRPYVISACHREDVCEVVSPHSHAMEDARTRTLNDVPKRQGMEPHVYASCLLPFLNAVE